MFKYLKSWKTILTFITFLTSMIFLIVIVEAGNEQSSLTIKKSLVKISVASQSPDYDTPWNPGLISQNFGTGFLIDDHRIMTNAHVVSNARFITLEKEDDSRRYEAKVKFIAHDCDLAILEVLDNSLLDGMSPLNFGGTPSLNSTVTVWGYPVGGEKLSITEGVVSRIDYQLYSHSSVDQQGYSGDVAQNVGYMIPVPVIHRFLKDIEDGHYDNYVDIAISYFPLLNKAHRLALGLGPGDYGVVVSKVLQAGKAYGILEVEDVLMAIDDMPIFSDGTVEMDGERVHMAEVVERKFKGDSVRLKIMRQGQSLNVNVPLTYPWPYLLQAWLHDVQPSFIVYGGLVFQPLSKFYLHSANIKKINILYYYHFFVENELYLDWPEIIILTRVLPDPINAYASKYVHSIVDKVNGRKIRRLKDLSEALKEEKDYTVIEFMGRGSPIVFKQDAVDEARQRILSQYGVLKEEYLETSIVPDGWKVKSSD